MIELLKFCFPIDPFWISDLKARFFLITWIWILDISTLTNPLRFQKNFQFTLGVNTVLKFNYECLRGFCEECGLMTHDTGECIPNDDEEALPHDDNDRDEGDDDANHQVEEDHVYIPDPMIQQLQQQMPEGPINEDGDIPEDYV
ncbi:unnamed protein product [Microthlaspi erraticum]|uniref:Zinc knuckle CX2CX4HX4C domain-containing protein n=1 Tax=Microthlaspi erraticum TaxID=1685480 RepID=A0A6D2HRB7_9BRAS|nr:unnamed protein product [Microthlaspi erraticum]